MEIIIPIIIGIIILSLLVFVHEAGHFLAAKFFGVKVEEFGFGFPIPGAIWSKKRGETTYSINWLPAGGFVRLYGEEGEGTTDPRSFSSKPWWQRALIVVAGVVVNLVVGVVIFTALLAASGFKQDFPLLFANKFPFGTQTYNGLVSYVDPGSAADKAGLKAGDKVVTLDGKQIGMVGDLASYDNEKAGQTVTLTIQDANSKLRDLTINPVGSDFGLIVGVDSNSPASQAGIEKWDKILSVDGKNFTNADDIRGYVKDKAGTQIIIVLENLYSKEVRTVNVTPRKNPPAGQGSLGIALEQGAVLVPGAELTQITTVSYNSPAEKIFSGVLHSANVLEFQWTGISSLFSQSIQEKSLAPVASQANGPVGIVAIISFIVNLGGVQALLTLLNLTALISLVLGAVNVLPIPAMDGGRLFFILLEGIRGKKISPAIENRIHYIGIIVLIFLFVLITFNDISKIFTGHLFG